MGAAFTHLKRDQLVIGARFQNVYLVHIAVLSSQQQ